jgi:hypothetical protein
VGAEDIRLTTQAQQWQISTAGANAVLLKMDDIQKRVNTPNAVYQKGNQSEQNVLQPKAIPKIGITGYRPAVASHFAVDSKNANQLFKKLKAKTDEQDCPNLYEARFFEEDRVSVYPLNAEQVVVQVPCWRGAYNEGLGYGLWTKHCKRFSSKSPHQAQVLVRRKFSQSKKGGVSLTVVFVPSGLGMERLLSLVIRHNRSNVKALQVVRGTYPLMSRSLRERIKSRLRLV